MINEKCSLEKYCHKVDENCNPKWHIITNGEKKMRQPSHKTSMHRKIPELREEFLTWGR